MARLRVLVLVLVAALAGCNLDFAQRSLDAASGDTGDTDEVLDVDLELDQDGDDDLAPDVSDDLPDTTPADTGPPPPDVVSDCSVCGELETCCELDGGAAICTDLASDPFNCGSCGQPCAAGEVCAELECCLPVRCEAYPAELCGTYADGCGSAITCDCQAPLQCGLQAPNRCAAVASFRLPDSATPWCANLLISNGSCPAPGESLYGQDGNYEIHPPSWHLSEAIATDLVTGLQWTREPTPGALSLAQAIGHCEASTLGDYEDWRIPTLLELVSLLDHGKPTRLYDETVFPTPLGTLLSATAVGLQTVTVAMDQGELRTASQGIVLCVRGTTPARAFVATGEQSAEDTSLGLMWTTTATAQIPWNDALQACETLALGGLDDWRMPALRELVSLLETQSDGQLIPDPSIFALETSKEYWSATPRVQNDPLGAQVWTLRFDQAETHLTSSTNNRNALCVRNTDLSGAP